MCDVCVRDVWTAQAPADLASDLGAAGIGLEGGGAWEGVAHDLVGNGPARGDVAVLRFTV